MSLLQARLHERSVASAQHRAEATIALSDLACGAYSVISGISAEAPAEVARRLFDLGFVPGTQVEAIRKAPLADPMIFTIAGYDIALRRAQARLIDVSVAA